jgi:hypothetical protein
MVRLAQAESAVDIVTLPEELRKRKQLESIGGIAYIFSLTEGLPIRPEIDSYIAIVKDKTTARRLITIGETLAARAYDGGYTGQEIAAWGIEAVSEITTFEDGFRLTGLGELLAQPQVEVDYLVEGMLLRGTVSGVFAKPKVGKSTLARNLCLAVSRGAEFLGRSTKRGSCIYLALEERKEEVVADFRAMGADGSEAIKVYADAVPEAAIHKLAGLVQKERPALVVIDPIIRLVRVRDEKAYAEMYAALAPLIDSARTTGTHIHLSHHSSKAPKTDAVDSPLGTTALGAAVATLIYLKRTERYRFIQTVQRVGVWMPETVLNFNPEKRLMSVGDSRAEEDLRQVEEEIVEYLRSVQPQEQTEPQICNNVEGRTSLKRKALRSLVKEKTVQRVETGTKGDPFKYLFPCSQPIPGTRKQESENWPQPCADADEKLVPENRKNLILVSDIHGRSQ